MRVRVSPDRVTWSPWQEVLLSHDAPVPSGLATFAMTARFAQYAVTANQTGSSGTVELSFVDPGPTPRQNPRERFLALGVAAPPVVSRTSWGCPEGQNSPRWPRQATTVTHAIVHHTATPSAGRDWAAEVRSIWKWHSSSNGWGDVGYNFLIDPNGTIYEGRAGGAGTIGAHFSCMNANTVGVALIGTYSVEKPTAAARASLVRLLAWLAEQNAIDPKAVRYHASSQLQLSTISGHRDGNLAPHKCGGSTCPGDTVALDLPILRQDVANALQGKTGVDTIRPLFTAFSVTPTRAAPGSPVTIGATATDSGGSGLARLELWRAIETNGVRGAWTLLQTAAVSGNGPIARSFYDYPAAGNYWYGVHAVDRAGNVGVEPASPGPIRVQVSAVDTIRPQIHAFSVAASIVTSGSAASISFAASDGQSGIERVELFRAADAGGRPGAWYEISRRAFGGAQNASGAFSDWPAAGRWWYGLHVVDRAGNMTVEPWPPGPLMVEVRSLVDLTPPQFRLFDVAPAWLRSGQATYVSFDAIDAQSGLDRIELWRAADVNGRPGAWYEVSRRYFYGASAVNGSFEYRPPVGRWWFGVHAVDVKGNVAYEPAPGPRLVTVQ
ncbi:MAG TPA: N-acetylmuramoyl-L-alanine amidase [Thermoanaerobaculia bacterium]